MQPGNLRIGIRVDLGGGVPFAYGGGLGSNELLAKKLGGLAVVWPHCNMLEDGTQVDEPRGALRGWTWP